MEEHDQPCCGACGHAAEVAGRGGAAPGAGPHLRVALGADGAPRDAFLVLQGRSAAPETIPLRQARVVLGRTPPADIVVDSPVLSRRQCAFDLSTGVVLVEDLRSTCGTYVNGETIGGSPRALRAGDEVRVGDLILVVHVGAAP
jgi:pSer/pThr/pTyr-binding forkhead associated (FHA) protein